MQVEAHRGALRPGLAGASGEPGRKGGAMAPQRRRLREWTFTQALMRALLVPAILLASAAFPAAAQTTVVSCPFSGVGDLLERGFYVTDYPQTTIDTVTLSYSALPGEYSITLSVHLDTYGGTLVGTSTQVVDLDGIGGITPV